MTQANSKSQDVEDKQPSLQDPKEASLLSRLRRIIHHLPQRLLISLILFSIALSFNLYRLEKPSIWFDEAFSVELARQPLPLLWHIIFGLEPNMELYYLFLHFWLGLTNFLGFNPTEFVVRFPSAIFAALSTVVVFLLGQRFLGSLAGVIGAILYLLNDLQLVYAQQTRAYSLQLLLICLAWYTLLVALTCTSHARRWWIGYVFLTTLAIYTHLFSGLVVLAQVLTVAGIVFLPNQWREEAWKQRGTLVVSLLAIGVLIIPMGLVSLQGAKNGWLPIPHLQDLLHLFLTISGDSKRYLFALALCGVLSVVIALLAYGFQYIPHSTASDSSKVRRELLSFQPLVPMVFALLCWLLVPIVVSFIVSHGSLRLFSSRYLVTVVPPLFLLVGLGVKVLRWRVLQIGAALGLIFLAVSVVPLYYRSAQVEDWNSTAHWLEQHYQAGDGLVCYDNAIQQGCQISMEYYLHAYPSAAHFTDDSPGAFSWQNYGLANPASSFDAAVDPAVLAKYGAKYKRIFFIVGRLPDDKAALRAENAQHWLDSHSQLVDQIVTRTVTIRLYITGGQ